MNKLPLLIILILIINKIRCQSDWSEENLYNKAKHKCAGIINGKFRCFQDGIYYNNTIENGWMQARHLCSQKFFGSSYADLISLEGVERVEGAKSILKNYTNQGHLIHFITD